MKTTADFVEAATNKHGDRYDYSQADYVNARTKVIIVCRQHGAFQQLPRKHNSGSNCPRCAFSSANDYRRTTVSEFINRSMILHGDRYDYSLITTIAGQLAKVPIICRIHGVFEQAASSHLTGFGCRRCSRAVDRSRKADKLKYDNDWFVARAIETHGNRYDYSESIYVGSANRVVIGCRTHGPFEQTARDHLCGYGCGPCGLDGLRRANARTTTDFIIAARAIHKDRYDYELARYVNKDTKIDITCPDHGLFAQSPHHHLHGQGCPICHISTGQLSLYNLVVAGGFTDAVCNDRTTIAPLELDIFIPSRRLSIEFNGLYWHSYNKPETADERNRHNHKLNVARAHNIELIQIFENEWLTKRTIVESIIRNRLGLSARLFARNLDVVNVPDSVAAGFYDTSHLMGHRAASHHLGLRSATGLVCCMSFSKHHIYDYELIRYANLPGRMVVGGPSRLFKKFVTSFKPTSILSYADRRYATGQMYQRLGFDKELVTRPNYYYVLGTKIFSRQSFQKHKLAAKLEKFNHNLSEPLNMFANGYRRIWDAGHTKFVWRQS